jgi:hypothetical protein
MSGRLDACCCCCSLKTGIIALGCAESFMLFLYFMAIVAASYFGLNKDYEVIGVYVSPVVSELPKVVAFVAMLCRDYDASSRACYYKVRLFSLITGVLCAIT